MKKWKLFLLFAVVAAGAVLLTGCGCEHENARIIDAVDATCLEEGYSGDKYCPDCKKVIEKGKTIEAYGHAPMTERVRVKEASCLTEGYTGDIVCIACDEILEAGEVIPMADHVPGERTYGYEPNCESQGFTGSIYCTVCGNLLEDGEIIPPLGHNVEVLEKVKEATCTEEGYTGEGNCTRCEKLIKGEIIPRTPHDFDEDGVCKICGWKTPGLYVDGKLELAWDKLLEASYVQMDGDNNLKSVSNALIGELVVDESITMINRTAFQESQLTSVLLPAGVTSISNYAFGQCTNLEKVVAFGKIETIGEQAFRDCTKLTEFVFAEGLTTIDENAFRGSGIKEAILPSTVLYVNDLAFYECADLEKVELNEGLISIGSEAFANCPKLTELNLPGTLESFYNNVIRNSGVKALVFPDTTTIIKDLIEAPELKVLDMSRATVGENFRYNLSLNPKVEEIYFPQGAQAFNATNLRLNPSLRILALPSTLTIFDSYYDYTDFIKSSKELYILVWPSSLTDGTVLSKLPNLKLVLYTGSEFQWSMITDKEDMSDVTVIFDAPQVAGDELKEIVYQKAKEFMEAGEFGKAYDLFYAIPGYSDVEDIVDGSAELKTAALEFQYSAGHTMTLGTYEQDADKANGAEPIEWLILDADGNNRLIISKYVLDVLQFNAEDEEITWAKSGIHTWLNKDFYKKAFTDDEMAMILETKVNPDKEEGSDSKPGKSTLDNVFLLNYAQANRYFESAEEATTDATPAAVENGVYSWNGNAAWWLAASGYNNYYALGVNCYSGYDDFYVDADDIGVRPAMWVDITSLLK